MPTLNWIGKEKVVNHHLDVPFKILQHKYGFSDGKQSNQETKSGNMIIHGDNLEALKSLLPQYEGKVNCIYIDPPYNTGNEDWIYSDSVNDPRIKKWLGDTVGKEGEDLTRHDKWLCMMYPRLRLLQKLLSKDGALIISIGHQEISNLMLICKDIFGDKQVVCITVQTSGGKPSGGFNYQHEYLIFIVPNEFQSNPLLYSGGQERSPYEGLTLATFTKPQRPNQAYPIFVNLQDGTFAGTGKSLQERVKNGDYKGKLEDFSYDYNEAPAGTAAIWPITSKGTECVWRLISSRLKSDWEKGYIKITENKSKNAENKFSIQYLPSGVIQKIESGILEIKGRIEGTPTLEFGENKTVGGQVPTVWSEKSFHTVKGTSLLNSLFSERKFTYPKPVELVAEALRAVSSKNGIIIDSFAGSGTTGHAVLNLNKEDGGDRKFILVEMMDYADSITAERNKKIITGYGEGDDKVEGTGGAFDFYDVGDPLFTPANELNEKIGVEKIREYIWYTETQSLFEDNKQSNPYYLGINNDTEYYFYYEKDRATTLNYDFLASLPKSAEGFIIYADQCTLPEAYMKKHNIIFKKIPRDITKF